MVRLYIIAKKSEDPSVRQVMEQRFFAAFEGQPACYPERLLG